MLYFLSRRSSFFGSLFRDSPFSMARIDGIFPICCGVCMCHEFQSSNFKCVHCRYILNGVCKLNEIPFSNPLIAFSLWSWYGESMASFFLLISANASFKLNPFMDTNTLPPARKKQHHSKSIGDEPMLAGMVKMDGFEIGLDAGRSIEFLIRHNSINSISTDRNIPNLNDDAGRCCKSNRNEELCSTLN